MILLTRSTVFSPRLSRDYTPAEYQRPHFNISKYGFFSYAVSEALYLSEQEKDIISSVFDNIRHELSIPIDHFSQDIVIAQIEQLLHYSNRF